MKNSKISLAITLSFLSFCSMAESKNQDVTYSALPEPISAFSSLVSMFSETDHHEEQLSTYWGEQYSGASAGKHSIQQAREIATNSSNVRVGIVDGGFVNTPDVQYSEGYSFISSEGYSAIYESPESDRGLHCDTGHGNAVASLIAANPQGNGIKGVSDATLVAARALKCEALDINDVADAVKWLSGEPVSGVPLISEPVDVINMSLYWGNFCTGPISDAIDTALNKGISIVTSLGNSSSNINIATPNDCPGVISVGSNSLDGFKTPMSDYGVYSDIFAHGDSVTIPTLVDEDNDGEYDWVSGTGTSLAAPLVTGTIALMLGENPSLTPTQINVILKSTSGETTASNLYTGTETVSSKYSCDNGVCGYGILNSLAAVNESIAIRDSGLAVKNPLEGECDVQFYLDTVGDSVDICSMAEFKIKANVETDNTKIEVYSGNDLSILKASTATFIGESTSGKYLLDSLSDGTKYGFRICEKNYVGDYVCWTDELTPLNAENLSKPTACTQ